MLKSTLALAALCSAFSAVAATGTRNDGDGLRSDPAAAEVATTHGATARAIGDVATQTGPTGLAMVAAGLLVLTGLSRRRGF